MFRLARPALAFVFALVIALTSGAMAVARGQASAAGEIVICTGQGVVSVAVDAEGQPTGPAHICPDCSLGLFDLSLAAPTTGRAAPGAARRVALPPAVPAAVSERHAFGARAPPVA